MSILDRILWARITAKAQTFVFSVGFIAVLAGWCLIHFDNDYKPVQMKKKAKPELYIECDGTSEDSPTVFRHYEGYCTKVRVNGGSYTFIMKDGTVVTAPWDMIDNDLTDICEFNDKCEEYYKK